MPLDEHAHKRRPHGWTMKHRASQFVLLHYWHHLALTSWPSKFSHRWTASETKHSYWHHTWLVSKPLRWFWHETYGTVQTESVIQASPLCHQKEKSWSNSSCKSILIQWASLDICSKLEMFGPCPSNNSSSPFSIQSILLLLQSDKVRRRSRRPNLHPLVLHANFWVVSTESEFLDGTKAPRNSSKVEFHPKTTLYDDELWWYPHCSIGSPHR